MNRCSNCGKYFMGKVYKGNTCQGCYKYFLQGGTIHKLPEQGVIEYDERGCIICHVCGMAYKRLGSHIRESHNMTIKEYKEKYGLCNSCKTTETKYSSLMREYAYENKMPEKLRESGKNTRIKKGERDKRFGKKIRLQEKLDKERRFNMKKILLAFFVFMSASIYAQEFEGMAKRIDTSIVVTCKYGNKPLTKDEYKTLKMQVTEMNYKHKKNGYGDLVVHFNRYIKFYGYKYQRLKFRNVILFYDGSLGSNSFRYSEVYTAYNKKYDLQFILEKNFDTDEVGLYNLYGKIYNDRKEKRFCWLLNHGVERREEKMYGGKKYSLRKVKKELKKENSLEYEFFFKK